MCRLHPEFIRQQWRMWIETGQQQRWQLVWAEFIRQQWRMWIETMCWSACEAFFNNSFASNGECGLKRHLGAVLPLARHKFIRQQWRMWIETGSTASTKQSLPQFIRQQWRMWIETSWHSVPQLQPMNSFASNGECGLKQFGLSILRGLHPNSFASNGECGLKPQGRGNH